MRLPSNRPSSAKRSAAYGTIALSVLIGGSSLPALGLFMLSGPVFSIIRLRDPETAFMLNVGLSLLFFVQHSLMVRAFFQKRLRRAVSEMFAGAVYSVASGTCLWLLLICWQPSSTVLFSADGWVYWGMRGLFALAVLGFFWANHALGYFDSLGIRSIFNWLKSKEETPPQTLVIRGPYQWVRHPLYLLSLMMIWSQPHITFDRLQFNLLWTVWIVIGTILEERDMILKHGTAYRKYRANVPMLFPLPGKRMPTDTIRRFSAIDRE